MTEEKISEQTAAAPQPQTITDVNRRIPGTSVAVMIFILLLAFLCAGVQVVTTMVEAEHAPEVIKGKGESATVDYPVLSRLPEGIAAEVNGVEIPESQITDNIMSMRARLGVEDQESWDAWMLENPNTTETLRNRVILYYVNNEVISQMAEELGIQPTDEDYQATRDELYGDPETKQAIEDALAVEGRTLDDYETEIVDITKRRMIGRAGAEALVGSSEFDDAVLTVIKERYPEYKDAESLDEVDDQALIDEIAEEVVDVNVDQAFSNQAHDFLVKSKIYYAEQPNDLPYQSGSDSYFMKEEFKASLKEALKKSGVNIGEDGLLGSLMADEDASSE